MLTLVYVLHDLMILHQGRDVDLLLGLDMLKSYQASIDLEKNVLRIQGREIPFLSEHELPAKARGLGEEEALNADSSGAGTSVFHFFRCIVINFTFSGPSTGPQRFPGGGATLGGPPAPRLATAGAATPGASNIRAPGSVPRPPNTPAASSRSNPTAAGSRPTHSEANIAIIMDLGATREVAISMLDAAGGNVDAAASLLF